MASAGYELGGELTAGSSLSLRLTICWSSEDDEGEVVLKSSGALSPFSDTSA